MSAGGCSALNMSVHWFAKKGWSEMMPKWPCSALKTRYLDKRGGHGPFRSLMFSCPLFHRTNTMRVKVEIARRHATDTLKAKYEAEVLWGQIRNILVGDGATIRRISTPDLFPCYSCCSLFFLFSSAGNHTRIRAYLAPSLSLSSRR